MLRFGHQKLLEPHVSQKPKSIGYLQAHGCTNRNCKHPGTPFSRYCCTNLVCKRLSYRRSRCSNLKGGGILNMLKNMDRKMAVGCYHQDMDKRRHLALLGDSTADPTDTRSVHQVRSLLDPMELGKNCSFQNPHLLLILD